MVYSQPGSSVGGILQARIPEWVAIPFLRRSSQPRDRAWVSCIADRLFTVWATREAEIVYHVCKRPLLSLALATSLKVISPRAIVHPCSWKEHDSPARKILVVSCPLPPSLLCSMQKWGCLSSHCRTPFYHPTPSAAQLPVHVSENLSWKLSPSRMFCRESDIAVGRAWKAVFCGPLFPQVVSLCPKQLCLKCWCHRPGLRALHSQSQPEPPELWWL